MANSQFQYVKAFEQETHLIPSTFLVVRVDGRGFHRFSKQYCFQKPNDIRALDLMNKAATGVMKNVSDLILAYGDSDEYSFVFDKNTTLFERRETKLVSTIVSTFTSEYVFNWPEFFPDTPLQSTHLPTFDGRAVVYPSLKQLRDYVSWRQVDCHINNLYNTTFWTLVERGGRTPQQAEEDLRGSLAADKNEILFSKFGINYNNELPIFRKGTILVWKKPDMVGTETLTARQLERRAKKKAKSELDYLHQDIVLDEKFWQRPEFQAL